MKTRDEDIVDYVSGGERIAREMRYVSETTEGERIGDWPPPPSTMRTHRLHKQGQKIFLIIITFLFNFLQWKHNFFLFFF